MAIRNHRDHLCTAEFFVTMSRDTQANLHIPCSSHTLEPTIFRAVEARTTRNRLAQMLNTSIRVWSSFCCMLTPSSLVRLILSVNYSIAWVKFRCKLSQRWNEYKKTLDLASIVTDLSPQQRLAVIGYIYYQIKHYKLLICSYDFQRTGRAGAGLKSSLWTGCCLMQV